MKLVLKNGEEIPVVGVFEHVWRNLKDGELGSVFDYIISVTVKDSTASVEALHEKLTDDAVSFFFISDEDSLSNASYEGYALRSIQKTLNPDGVNNTVKIEFIKM